jgi:hypothetical protein
MEKEEEPINLDNLSQRELLIVLARDVRDMKKDMHKMEQAQQEIQMKVNTLETKSKVNGALMGFLAGLGSVLIDRLIK